MRQRNINNKKTNNMNMHAEKLENTLKAQYNTITSVSVSTGGFACWVVGTSSEKDAQQIVKEFTLATGAKANYSACFKSVDVFDEAGELIDIIDTDEIEYYLVSCMFGKDYKKNAK